MSLSEEGLEVKKQLEELQQSKRRVRNIQEELKALNESIDMLKSAQFGMPGGSGGEKLSGPERYAMRLEELKEKLSLAIDTALFLEDQFFSRICELDVLSQNLLMERYFTGKPIRRIVRDFNYDERHIYRLYNKSFEELGKTNEIVKNK